MNSVSHELAYFMKIRLTGSKPSIWRAFCVPGEISLDRLHDVIQIVMGWLDCHYHTFEIGGRKYSESFAGDALDAIEEDGLRLCDLVSKPSSKFSYEYDFGDRWWHELVVESIEPVPKGHRACISCLDGKGCCPPEDVGGINGYAEFLAALRDTKHPEHENYKEWAGGSFDPKAFDLSAINLELLSYVRWSRPRKLVQDFSGKPV